MQVEAIGALGKTMKFFFSINTTNSTIVTRTEWWRYSKVMRTQS